jgi:hypothetical protein
VRPTRVGLPLFGLVWYFLFLTSTGALAAQATATITGKVTADGGVRPLAAVQVVVVGTPIRAQTNDAGEYDHR